MSFVRILIGDVRDRLRELPTAYFDCVVTSPPYWGLRDYGTGEWVGGDAACDHMAPMPGGFASSGLGNYSNGLTDETIADKVKQRQQQYRHVCGKCGSQRVDRQIGLERTLGEHLDVMVDVFREVRRVLKQQGTLWLNYGDCYAAAPNGKSAAAYKADGTDDRTFRDKPFSTVGAIYEPGHSVGRGQRGDDTRQRASDMPGGRIVAGGMLKPKDLCMIPNRLAIALQDDGWWVRSEIIWHKPNPMPESVYDRPTTAHEKVWLLTKGEDYFYNHEAIREPVTGGANARRPGPASRENQDRTPRSRKIKVPGWWDVQPGAHGTINRSGRTEATYVERPPSVTPKATAPGSGIKNNTSFAAAVCDIVSETRNARNVWTIAPRSFREAHFATFPPDLAERCIKAGVPDTICHLCGEAKTPEDCGGVCAGQARDPGRVLDPFGGAGTVGLVAKRRGLDCTLIELNPEYATMAERRIKADDGPPCDVTIEPPVTLVAAE